jgi:hypothetical protein
MPIETTRRNRRAAWTVLLAMAAAAAAQAQDGANEGDDELGMAMPCLNQPSIRQTRIINDRNIAFFTRNGKIYNNELPRQCPSLRRRSLVNYAIANGRICQGTQFQVMWEAGTGNFVPAFVCTLGAFVPITQEQFDDLEELTATEQEPRARRRRSAREAVTTEQVELPPAEAEPGEEPVSEQSP